MNTLVKHIMAIASKEAKHRYLYVIGSVGAPYGVCGIFRVCD